MYLSRLFIALFQNSGLRSSEQNNIHEKAEEKVETASTGAWRKYRSAGPFSEGNYDDAAENVSSACLFTVYTMLAVQAVPTPVMLLQLVGRLCELRHCDHAMRIF